MIENVHIIVVEDDPSVRKLARTALMYCVNREVKTFENGAAAWDYLSCGGRADIVLSDVDMPELNGLDLLGRIKSEFKETIVILMSGVIQNEPLASRGGADAFLAKPFAITDLFDIVQTYVVD